MSLDPRSFEYLRPTDKQMADMGRARTISAQFVQDISSLVPEGPDKTYILRKFREVAMWVNVAITRQPDGGPRIDS